MLPPTNFKQIAGCKPDASQRLVCAMSVYYADRLNWLKEAVTSVLNQTLAADIFIITIDGPISLEKRDFLLQIAAHNPSVVILESTKNQGLSRAMNFAISWALPCNPEFFFRMDADDICHLDRFRLQTEFLKKHPDVDVLGSWINEIDESGNVVGQRVLPLSHFELVRRLGRKCPINHPSVAIRFEVFKNGHRYLEDLPNTQDYFLWIELAANGYRFANLQQKLLKFRRVDGFYKRRGRSKSVNEFNARLLAMKQLDCFTLKSISYAVMVLILRVMPSPVVKLAYRVERALMKRSKVHL